MVVEEVKEELKKLCTDYLNILQQLKKDKTMVVEKKKMIKEIMH